MERDWKRELDGVRALLKESTRGGALFSPHGGPPIAHLPEGPHIIRWLFGPRGEIWRDLELHQIKHLLTLCPDREQATNPTGDYPSSCEICALATQRNDWRLQRRRHVLIYGYVGHTTQKSQFWLPRKTYVINGPPRLRVSLIALLKEWIVQQPEDMLAMLTPHVAGPATSVDVKKGRQGSITMTPYTDESFPPISLGDWYIPLDQCWIGPEFNLVDYQACLAEVKAQEP
jgi:hypothetical protein